MNALLVATPLLPLGAAVVELSWRGARGRALVTASALSLLCLVALSGGDASVTGTWAEVAGATLTVGLQADGLSASLALVFAAVITGVCAYSVGYMKTERARRWFFAWLGVFASAMLALVLARSFLLLFFAWEIVGVTSFVLIAWHHDDDGVRRAARKAFLYTRLADVALLLAWLWLWRSTGTTVIADALAAAVLDETAPLLLLSLLFVAGALGKSAQLPLSAWLPAAMVGPTPVSALLHSATMVAAGVYLLLRVYPLLAMAPDALLALSYLGAVTALTAALLAVMQRDLKRVLAWSTVAHLGEMFLVVGLSAPFAASFHLGVHAVLKAGLFLCAGAFERVARTRDVEELEGVGRRAPLASAAWLACALALAAVPPLAGWFSEEEVLASALARGGGWPLVVVALLFLSGLYIGRPTWRLLARVGVRSLPAKLPATMLVPCALFGAAAVVVGPLLRAWFDSALPFLRGATPPLSWTLVGATASVTGLALGALRSAPVERALASGRRLEPLVDGAGVVGAAVARAGARSALVVERALAAGGQWLLAGVRSAGRGVDLLERYTFADMAERAAALTVGAARLVDLVERVTFEDGGDRSGRRLLSLGARVASLQRGRIPVYSASLFVSAALLILVVALLAL